MSTTYNGTILEEISVDVSQPNNFTPRLVKEKDAYTRGYVITLTDKGEKLTIPTANTTAWFNCRNQTDPTKRASAKGTINDDGTVTAFVPATVMDVAGYIQCDVSIITASGNDTKILKSTLFYLDCQAAANPDGTSSTAEDTILAGISAGTIVPPAGPYVVKTQKVANIDLQDDIRKDELVEALSGFVDVIESETAELWGNSIPVTYDGNGYKFALWRDEGTLWYLSWIDDSVTPTEYHWERIANYNQKMNYAVILSGGVQDEHTVDRLPTGQVFSIDGKIGLKTSNLDNIRCYSDSQVDNMIGDIETLLAQV